MSVSVVDDAGFAAAVLAAPVPVLVEFGAEWCMPCRAVEPIMEQLATQYVGRVQVCMVDADAAVATVAQYGVRNLPTLLLFDRGTVVEKVIGARPAAAYIALLDQHLASRSAVEQATDLPAGVGVRGGGPASTERRASDRAWETPLWMEAPPDAASRAEAAALTAAAQPLLLFKHSDSCSISIAVKRELDAFRAAHPHLPTRVVVVQRERRLADALAVVLQVRHESPQALLVQDGRVLWHASHRRITTDALVQAFRAASSVDTVV